MTADLGLRHYGRGALVTGVLLLILSAIYLVQMAGVVRETLAIIANRLPETTPDGVGRQFDLRTVAIYHFYVTSHAWLFSHLWLLWVAVVQVARRPRRRLRSVRGAATMLALVVAVTWAMVLWLERHGTSV